MSVANKARVIALLCCLTAFLLSAWALDARSLWGDEAFSVWASKQDAIKLIAGLDAQPPLYHLALGATRALAGESVFVIRFLSVACGVLLVAVGANIGRRIGGVYVSILTALLLATSPILLYFMQEARMYSLAALMAGGAMLMTVKIKEPRAKSQDRIDSVLALGSWFLYLTFSLAALFTHFYTAGVLLANSIALGIAALRSRNLRRMVEWVIAHAAIAVIFLGWFIGLQSRYAVRSAQSRPRIVPLWEDIVNNIGRGINSLVFGMRAETGTTIFALVLFALALAGLLGYWRRGKRGVALLIAGWIGFSLLLVLLTAAPSGLVSDFNPRYFLFALLPLALAAGGWSLMRLEIRDSRLRDAHDANLKSQISNLSSPISAIVALVAMIPALIGISQLLDTSWQKSRYNELVAAIQQRSRPADGIVMVNSDQFVLMDYYGPTNLKTLEIRNDELSSAPAKVAAQVQQFMQDKGRVWLINFGWAMNLQPRSAAEQALAAKGARTYAQGFQDAALALYDLRSTGEDTPIQPKDVRFGGQIQLAGVRERSTSYLAGDAITLDLFWKALQKPQADYTVFMHLRKASDGTQIAAFDSPPANGAAPTSSWQIGQTITDTRAIAIPQDAPAGDYDVVIGLYQYPSLERLKIDGTGDTEYTISHVKIEP